jgi:hypothetical protein
MDYIKKAEKKYIGCVFRVPGENEREEDRLIRVE